MPDAYDYVALSQHLIRQTDAELEKGDHYQAAEKGWGAVAHAIKAVAEQRGWNHDNHFLLHEAAFQLSAEFDRADLMDMYDSAERLHQNFYGCYMRRDEVERRINRAKTFSEQLEVIRNSPPRPFIPQNHDQRRRLDRLTRQP